MTRLIGGVALIAMLTTGGWAQAPGLPVINSGAARGLTMAGMVGFGNDGAGSGTAFGVSGQYGLRRVAVGGFVSGLSGSTLADATSYAGGATLAVKVVGGPLVPVSLNFHTGVGYSAPSLARTGGSGTDRYRTWWVPIGLGLSWTFPQPVVAVKPWLSPRANLVRVKTSPGGVTTSDEDFAMSGGINFGFLNGLGIDVAFDRVFAKGTGSKPTTVGVGLSYSFK